MKTVLNPNRSLIICTCHNNGFSTTYCNSLDDKKPYIMTVRLNNLNSTPEGLKTDELPNDGETKFYPQRWTVDKSENGEKE